MTGPRTTASANPSGDELHALFDAPAPLTVGVEEELMLLDPDTLDLAPRAGEVLAALGGDGRFKLELPASQLEIMLPPMTGAGAVRVALAAARAELAAGAEGIARPAALALHPFAATEGTLNDGPRHAAIEAEYGAVARRQL